MENKNNWQPKQWDREITPVNKLLFKRQTGLYKSKVSLLKDMYVCFYPNQISRSRYIPPFNLNQNPSPEFKFHENCKNGC